MIGNTISKYKILEKLGEGGMGVVYKARDLKLERFVALKFLPHYFSSDEQRKKRFIQEAKAASLLDHPNIGTIYDVDEIEENQMFIVMAYYDGESLNDRLQREPLTAEETINITTQIANGLARAHEAGITHRYIKPANIIITKRGKIKIVDFGLAKMSGDSQITKDSVTPGTVAYMSPEQLMGDSIDSRTDIWSLGVVLYEMLTGRLPFKSEHEQTVIYSILKEKPDPIENNKANGSDLWNRILAKCLEKDTTKRYQTLATFSNDLDLLQQKPQSNSFIKFFYARNNNLSRPWYLNKYSLYAAILLLIIFTFYLSAFYLKSKPAPLMTEVPFTSLNGLENTPAFSPDGTQIAYYWKENDRIAPKIYIKTIATGETRRLTNSPGGERSPVWSPDRNNMAFVRGDNIYIISALGIGSEKLIFPDVSYGGLDWSPNGKWIAFTERDATGDDIFISLLSTRAGEKRSLTTKASTGKWQVDLWPVFSPRSDDSVDLLMNRL